MSKPLMVLIGGTHRRLARKLGKHPAPRGGHHHAFMLAAATMYVVVMCASGAGSKGV